MLSGPGGRTSPQPRPLVSGAPDGPGARSADGVWWRTGWDPPYAPVRCRRGHEPSVTGAWSNRSVMAALCAVPPDKDSPVGARRSRGPRALGRLDRVIAAPARSQPLPRRDRGSRQPARSSPGNGEGCCARRDDRRAPHATRAGRSAPRPDQVVLQALIRTQRSVTRRSIRAAPRLDGLMRVAVSRGDQSRGGRGEPHCIARGWMGRDA